MTGDHDALLAAVLAAPEEDLPRLAYADWCDDHGEPERAEFIRVQCLLAAPVEANCGYDAPHYRGCNCAEALRRERELWVALWQQFIPADWAGGVSVEAATPAYDLLTYDRADGSPGPMTRCLVRRGFVAEVWCPLAVWVGGECGRCSGSGEGDSERLHCRACAGTGRVPGVGPDLVRRHPVERVEVTDRGPVRVTGGLYEYVISDDPGRPAAIPWAVFDCFPAERLTTLDVARDALSAGLIAWAKAARHARPWGSILRPTPP